MEQRMDCVNLITSVFCHIFDRFVLVDFYLISTLSF
jgi:hypothetical protein